MQNQRRTSSLINQQYSLMIIILLNCPQLSLNLVLSEFVFFIREGK